MNRNKILHAVLAGTGCASLLVYILACSSFSPDDSQVLYPAFEKGSGAVSIMVYNRNTGRSEPIYTAMLPSDSITNRNHLTMRAQWLPDGKHVLIAHPQSEEGSGGLSFIILPRGVDGPVRHLTASEAGDSGSILQLPFCVQGSRLYLSGEKMFGYLDLRTGLTHEIAQTSHVFSVSGAGRGPLWGMGEMNTDEGMQLGVINPETLEFTPRLTLPEQLAKGVLPIFDPRDGRAMFMTDTKTNLQLHVMKDGRMVFQRAIERAGSKVDLGPWLHPGPRGDRLYTGYQSKTGEEAEAEYGVVEITLNTSPIRWIPLFRAKPEDKMELLLAQGSLSHDGTTWAVSTSYLYLENDSLKPEDCALYLVKVSEAKPKITKVPITPPAIRGDLKAD